MAGRFGDTGAVRNRSIAGVPLHGHDSQHYFLARFDTLGALVWIKFIGANDASSTINLRSYLSTTNPPYGVDDHSLAIDGQGYIHYIAYLNKGVKITPSLTAQTGTYNLKYDAAGTLVGAVRLGVDSNYFLFDRMKGGISINNSVSISKRSGKIFAVMYKVEFNALRIPVYTQYRLCAFAPSGALLWEDSLAGNSSTHPQARIRDACYDGGNGIYLSGEGIIGQFIFAGAAPAYPTLPNTPITAIIKVDSNGTPQWIYANRHYGNLFQLGNTTILPNANILAAGAASGVISHGKDSVVLSARNCGPYYTIVSPGGNPVKIGGVPYIHKALSNRLSLFSAAAVDKTGNIYLGGYNGADTLKFPGGITSVKSDNISNPYDAFIAKLGLDCRCTAPAMAGYKDSMINEKTYQFRYTGTTEVVDSVVWRFGKGQKKKVTSGISLPFQRSYASSGAYSRDTVCVFVYSACGVDSFCKYPAPLGVASASAESSSLQVYPNPAQSGRFSVVLESGAAIREATITVTDLTGRQVFHRRIAPSGKGFRSQVEIAGAAPGVYFVELRTETGRSVRKIVLE